MRLTQRLVDKSKERLLTPAVLRWVTDDRVMKATEGLMDARLRVKAAWDLLLNGHALPNVDPALDESIGTRPVNGKKNGSVNGVNGTNGHVHGDGELGHPSAASLNGNGVKANGSNGAHAQMHGSEDMEVSMKERSSLASIGGKDVLEKCQKFMAADNARKRGIYPFFRPLDLNDGPEAVINGRRVVMFGSNNYLGLTTHPKVREAAKAAIDRFGTSMTGSRLVNGSMKLHEEFEEKLARYFGKESALVFTTGYQVNLAMCAALLSNKQSVAVIDRNVHASLYDGARLGQAAGATLVRYRHNDAESLDKVLEKLGEGEGALVITDGVFSAEGEIAKLDEIVPVVKRHGARLFVDDAHALGVIGPGGRGTSHHFGVADQVDLIGGTFSKSLASIGGWLVGERKVLDYIRHFAPSFMFAAAAAPPCVAAAMAAFDVMQEEAWRIDKLRENFTYMRDELRGMGFELGHTQTAVIPIFIRQDLRTIMMWRDLLEEHGIYTNPFISPGVPPKSAMLRTSYMATHDRSHLDRGLEAFRAVGKKYGVI
ncbi:MAG: aminotransferase class I/II-fold pyridoxal phosphate-dependent enzyme [Myxococcota bacterium]|nr:aminotransferase class I/II-fold pyridoxal phosphate-dependent enzyme [Myxococcota bacterium]